MYYNGKWYEECEMSAFVRQLERERDAYKNELVLWLGKIGECDVPLAFPAHLRLEELIGKPHVNICEGD